MKNIFIQLPIAFFALFIVLTSCEEMEILPPPTLIGDPGDGEDPGTGGQTGTGKSTASSMLFVNNDVDTEFVDDGNADTWVSTQFASTYFANTNFAQLADESDLTSIQLDVLPTLKFDEIMELQEVPEHMTTTTFPGAFGTEVQPEWSTNSNWWVLEPQNIDYGYDESTVEVIAGGIETNTTWTKDKKYLIDGQVFVRDGATLTIEPGTVIFGRKSTGVESGVLVVNRGGKLMANGTPDEPIVFTGTYAMGERSRGQWGGVVLLGKGMTNKGEDVLVEGIQGDGSDDGLYGGTDNADSSGEMSYVRIEYAGVALTPGNEINSLTFAGVGSGTKVHHIIVTYAGDDAYEWFGGAVDLTYAAAYNTLDDDMDMDAGYQGNVQFAYIVRNPFNADESGSSCFEVSSSSTEGISPQTSATVQNATVVGPAHIVNNSETLIVDPKFRGGVNSSKDAKVTFQNSIIIGCPVGVDNP